MVVVQSHPSLVAPFPLTAVHGLFVDDDIGWLNAAQCLADPAASCVRELPSPERGFLDIEDAPASWRTDVITYPAGEQIRLGPWTAGRQVDIETERVFYWGADNSLQTTSLDALTLAFSGAWGAIDMETAAQAPTPVTATRPSVNDIVELHENAPLDLAWIPGLVGDLFLFASGDNFHRMIPLADDGSAIVDLSDLRLAPATPIDLRLERWAHTAVVVDGRAVQLVVQSRQQWTAVWSPATSRLPLNEIPNDCTEARASPPLGPGNYEGDLSGRGNSFFAPELSDDGPTCSFVAAGSDGVVPIEVPADHTLVATLRTPAADASLGLLADCETGQCLAAADTSIAGTEETLSWRNVYEQTQRVYVSLDTIEPIGTTFTLDIELDAPGEDVLEDTCVEAIAAGPAASGNYTGLLLDHSDAVSPPCAGTTVGGDGIVQVRVAPGQTLTADVTVDSGDPHLYLMFNCSVPASCFLEANAEPGVQESIAYTNLTAFEQFVYLVVDGQSPLRQAELVLAVE